MLFSALIIIFYTITTIFGGQFEVVYIYKNLLHPKTK